MIIFQSTHPGWGATLNLLSSKCGFGEFQSTHPGWGATCRLSDPVCTTGDFNPRTPGGVRLHQTICLMLIQRISIHAPRVGCDTSKSSFNFLRLNFNPRTPGGVRLSHCVYNFLLFLFQSTHPGWGATLIYKSVKRDRKHISIHAPRVGCDN